MATKPRDYKAEYAKYQGKPEQIANRSARNSARRAYTKANGAIPEGEDIDHKKAMSKGGGAGVGNLRSVPKSENRSFSRTKTGAMKSQISKSERTRSK